MLDAIKFLIELFKTKEINRKNLFDDFMEPLFVEFESTTAKYLKLFDSESIEELNKIRNEYIQTREKITVLQDVYLKDNDDDDVKNFLVSIHKFFFSPNYLNETNSIGENYIEVMTRSDLRKDFKNRLRQETKEQQLQAWTEAVKFYGISKSKYKRPIKF
jgi:hypothetical protein